jgi:hypothetical protein
MQDVKKNKKIVWELRLPEEVQMNYREWIQNPFPVFIERVTHVKKTGSTAIVGNDGNPDKIYIIFFPQGVEIPTIVEGLIMDVKDGKVVFIDEIENDSEENDDDSDDPF